MKLVLDAIQPQLGLFKDWDSLDGLELAIPFAGQTLVWHVLLSQFSVDFLFSGDEDFQPLCGSFSHQDCNQLVTLLKHWKDAAMLGPEALRSCLVSILDRLLQGFNSWQRGRVAALGIERLLFELSCSSPEAEAGDLGNTEVLLLQPPGASPKACFSIPITVDLSGLEQALGSAQQPVQITGSFRLLLVYPAVPGNVEPEKKLQVPPSLEGVLPPITLPNWTSHMCQIEYLPLLTDRCQAIVDAFSPALSLQVQLLGVLAERLGAPLDHNVFQGSALWSIAWEGVPLLLTVQANGIAYGHQSRPAGQQVPPKLLPDHMPLLTLTAVRHPDVTKMYPEYPWSPRWPPHVMAARILNFLSEAIPSLLGLAPAAAAGYASYPQAP